MVVLKIKQGNDHLFNFKTDLSQPVETVQDQIIKLFNHRLKCQRLCDEISMLAKHGVQVRPEMMGLTPDQIEELKLVDDYATKTCIPSSGFGEETPDDCGRRCGRPPRVDMQNVLAKTISEAKASIFKEGQLLDFDLVDEYISNLRGAVMIVYPMGLPPYDHIQLEFEGKEEESLSGTQASKAIISDKGSLWFASKKMEYDSGKLLSDYLDIRYVNEKSKVVIKIQGEFSQGAPGKEPQMDKETHQKMMMQMYKRQEEMKRLHEEAEFDQDSYLDSQWADPNAMKKRLTGLGNVRGF